MQTHTQTLLGAGHSALKSAQPITWIRCDSSVTSTSHSILPSLLTEIFHPLEYQE